MEKEVLNKDEPQSGSGRKKRKIRIKYRERVRIKERPKGSKLSRYWKKKKKNILIVTLMIALFGMTFFMVVTLVNQRIDMNLELKKSHMRIPD